MADVTTPFFQPQGILSLIFKKLFVSFDLFNLEGKEQSLLLIAKTYKALIVILLIHLILRNKHVR